MHGEHVLFGESGNGFKLIYKVGKIWCMGLSLCVRAGDSNHITLGGCTWHSVRVKTNCVATKTVKGLKIQCDWFMLHFFLFLLWVFVI